MLWHVRIVYAIAIIILLLLVLLLLMMMVVNACNFQRVLMSCSMSCASRRQQSS